MKTDILGYNIYRFCSEAAGPNLHPEARAVSTSSVVSLPKLPREVLQNFLFLPWVWYRLEVQQEIEGAGGKKGRCCLKYQCKHFFHSTCLAANWEKKKSSCSAVSSLSPQSSGSSSESRRSLSESWSVLLVLVASSSSSELPSQDVWNSLISSLNLWDTCTTK